MTSNDQLIIDEAARILRDYAHLTFREAIAKAIEIMTKKQELEGATNE